MNNLNSVLLEGSVTEVPELFQADGLTCAFSLYTERFYKRGTKLTKETSRFDVQAWDTLATTCSKHFTKGTWVRVVGRLRQFGDRVMIIAEHVEFKPTRKEVQE